MVNAAGVYLMAHRPRFRTEHSSFDFWSSTTNRGSFWDLDWMRFWSSESYLGPYFEMLKSAVLSLDFADRRASDRYQSISYLFVGFGKTVAGSGFGLNWRMLTARRHFWHLLSSCFRAKSDFANSVSVQTCSCVPPKDCVAASQPFQFLQSWHSIMYSF